jgi:hypothetical protein
MDSLEFRGEWAKKSESISELRTLEGVTKTTESMTKDLAICILGNKVTG